MSGFQHRQGEHLYIVSELGSNSRFSKSNNGQSQQLQAIDFPAVPDMKWFVHNSVYLWSSIEGTDKVSYRVVYRSYSRSCRLGRAYHCDEMGCS